MSGQIRKDIEGKIWVLTMGASTREASDIWAQQCWAMMAEAESEGRPFYLICDFSSPDVGMTPYLRQQALEVLQVMAGREGYLALVVSTSFGRVALTLFLRTRIKHHFQWQIFNTPEQALPWVQGKINTPAP